MVAKSLKAECDHVNIKLQIKIESKFCNKGQGALERCSRQPVVKSHVLGYFFVTMSLSFGFFCFYLHITRSSPLSAVQSGFPSHLRRYHESRSCLANRSGCQVRFSGKGFDIKESNILGKFSFSF